MPIRIQRKRTKGYKMPPVVVYVGRPTKWGNKYRVGTIITTCTGTNPEDEESHPMTAQECVDMHRRECEMFCGLRDEIKRELRGKDLACWCKIGSPCHGDTLLRIANE